jgi:hypothetical protein
MMSRSVVVFKSALLALMALPSALAGCPILSAAFRRKDAEKVGMLDISLNV